MQTIFFCRSRQFTRRLEETRGRLYRMAYAWSHNHALADDLVQETLAKALKNRHQLRDMNALDAWLFTILSNCWRGHYRREWRYEDLNATELVHELTPDRIHDEQEIVDHVRGAVANLPEGQRQVLTLVDLEEFSYNDVAQILDIPIGTVMSRLCRARRSLKTLLLDERSPSAAKHRHLKRVK